MLRHPALILWVGLAGVFALACGGDGAEGDTAGEVDATIVVPVTPGMGSASDITAERLVVLGDSSLIDALPQISQRFQGTHPGVKKVQHEFASSRKLAKAVAEGAVADVLVTASAEDAESVVDAGESSRSRVLAANELVIAVPKSLAKVSDFEDIAEEGVSLAVPAPDTTAGRYLIEILQKVGEDAPLGRDFVSRVDQNTEHEEPNVRAALARVREGDADAAIVYRTDVGADSELLEVIEIPPKYQVAAEYHVLALRGGGDPEASQAFADFLLSEAGKDVVGSYGFQVLRK